MGQQVFSRVVVGIACFVLVFVSADVAAQSNVGEVQIYVFSQTGLPVTDASVQVNGDVYTSDVNGLIDFRHPAGTHRFTILRGGQPVGIVEVPVRALQATEVIVTASREPIVQRQDQETRDAIQAEERAVLDADAPSGTLRGTVIGVEDGEPIAGATIIFRGVDFETTTNDEGVFEADIPRGEYSFSVIHPDFSTQTQDGIQIVADQTTEVEISLTPAAITLDEVAVFASEEVIVQGGIANLIEETRNSSAVLNLIGSEQIDRTGDSDAAGALARVTGLNIVGGRFVYVRGMGERYSLALLNDARLPSPEPDKRVVPLDLFPASVIESIAVQKSYSPDLPADFGGGAVSIRTAGIPDDRYQRRLRTQISASVGYNAGASLTEQLTEQRGSLSFLGFDDGTRALPEELDENDLTDGDGFFGDNYTQDEKNEFGRQLSNTWDPIERTLPLDYGASISVRDKIDFSNGSSFGFNIAALYANGWDFETGAANTFKPGPDQEPAPDATYVTETTTNEISLGALVDLVWEPRRGTRIEAVSLLLRSSDSEYTDVSGYNDDVPGDIRQVELSWTEDMVFSQSLGGTTLTELFGGTEFRGNYVFSLAQRYQPDARYALFIEEAPGADPGDNNYEAEAGNIAARRDDDNQRVWTTVTDVIHDAQLAAEFPVFLFGRAAPDFVDTGLYGMYQTRGTDIRRFGFVTPPGDVSSDPFYYDDINDLGDILDPDGFGTRIDFSEETYPADNYTAEHVIGAGFVALDALLFRDIRINLGTRVEYSRQTVDAFTFPTGDPQFAELATVDVLPAGSITFPVFARSQLRLAGSRTVNRPDLRELSSAPFFGPPGFGVLVGNPDLKRATILNADLRWEGYLSLTESYSIGVFAKQFRDAIEIVQLNDPAFRKVPVNTAEATNIGVELEWAIQLRFLSDWMRPLIRSVRSPRGRRVVGAVAGFLRDVRTTGNVALINSQIDYGDSGLFYEGSAIQNTSQNRPLVGQAPYVVNLAIGYRNEVSWSQNSPIHTSVFLNLNEVGPFITQLGVQGVPDQYQQPFRDLNLVVRQQIGYIFSFSAEVGNLLDPVAEVTLGESGEIVEKGRRGRTFSLSVSFDL